MIAPIRELDDPEEPVHPALSNAARQAAASLLTASRREGVTAVPAWQAWLLVAWMVVTSLAYVAITLGIWRK